MKLVKDLHKKITKKYGSVLDLKKKPKLLDDIFAEVTATLRSAAPVTKNVPPASPFGVDWMDSWVANWIVADKIAAAKTQDKEFAAVLQALVDAKFDQRIVEMRDFIKNNPRFEPPDAGPPEPGVPPVGPAISEPPEGGPPEPGVPDPPNPGPTGPGGSGLSANPWILLWFVSLRAPFIVDMIDAQMTRKLNELKGR